MGKKCRKLLALLTMFAMIVTYSFSASIVSVYADDEQGDVNAKAAASEESTPDPAPAEEPTTPSEPATPLEPSTPDTPQNPVDDPNGNATEPGNNDSAGGNDSGAVSEGTVEEGDEIVDPEIAAMDEEEGPSGSGTEHDPYVLKVGQTVTLEPSISDAFNFSWSYNGQGYLSRNGFDITYSVGSPTERVIPIDLHYWYWQGFWLREHTDHFYIKLVPQYFKTEFFLKDAGASGFASIKTEDVAIGGNATAPDLPATKEGEDGKKYKFYGWYSDEGCTTSASFSNITEDKEFYAKYEASERIIFKKNLTGESVTLPDDIEEAAGTSVNLGAASCSGYTFIEWNTDPSGAGESYAKNASIEMPEGGLTLYAIWEEGAESTTYINYWDTLSAEGSPIYVGALIRTDEDIEINSRPSLWDGIPPVVLWHQDDIFIGWSTRPGGSVNYYPGDTIEIGERPVDLYAVYDDRYLDSLDVTLEAKSDEVTYDGEEHSVEGYVGLEEDPDHPGYVLIRSRTVLGVTYRHYVRTDATTATGTNAGHYSTPVSAQVYRSVNGGRLTPQNAFVSVEQGALTINPAEIVINTDSATQEYNGEALTAGGTVTFGDGQEATFTAEGGTVSLFKDDTLNIRATGSQTEVGSSDNTYEVDWGKPDDWGSETSTAKKYNYTITEGSVGTLTVTPQTATLTFVLNGGTLNGSTDDVLVECYVGDEVTILQAPTKEGYKFVEWQGSSYQPGDKYKVEGDHTFTAVWEPVTADGSDDEGESEEVDTGDNMNMIVLIVVMIMAALSLIALVCRRRTA